MGAPRNRALDGVRGLAALSVALGHSYLITTGLSIWSTTARDFSAMAISDIGYRLLSLAFPADAAVMVFFVLSGHVLWQSFARKDLGWSELPDYVVSRIWRLLPVIAPATLLMAYFTPVSAADLLSNMLLLRTNVLGVTWSLQVEMVGSLAIVVMWLWSRNSTPKMVVALVAMVAIAPFARGTVLVYLPAFALGGLIRTIPENVWKHRALFWAGLALLLVTNVVFSHGGVARCFEMIGAAIVVGCTGIRPISLLQSSQVQFLGAISYPLYLCHPFAAHMAPLVTSSLPTTQGLSAFFLLSVVSLMIAIPIAWLLHIVVELPFMRWRQKLIAPPRITQPTI
jgi:peptidoglycan/LPS O-acetylase OafA/YrhL